MPQYNKNDCIQSCGSSSSRIRTHNSHFTTNVPVIQSFVSATHEVARSSVISDRERKGRVVTYGWRGQSEFRNLSEPILFRLKRARPSVARAAFAEICMDERERLPDASTRDTHGFLPWRTNRAFDSARDVIYPHLIWEFVHSRREGEKERERKREQAVRLFRFQRYRTTRERILINDSSFTRTPDLSEENLRLPASLLLPALQSERLSFSLFFPRYAGTILTSISDTRLLRLFSLAISGNASLPPISFFPRIQSFICRLTLAEPADYVTHTPWI